jgi:hypothetical protein
VSYRVEIETDRASGRTRARIFIGSSIETRFVIHPLARDSVASKWYGAAAIVSVFAPRGTLYLDPNGTPVPGSTASYSPTDNFGWLLDLAMEAGLEFPALQGG